MHIKKVTRLGSDVIEVQHYGFSLLGGPGKQRAEKKKRTDQQGKENNLRSRARHIQRLLLHNFKPGDLHIVLHFLPEKRPETYGEAVNKLRLFLRRVRKYYKERGYAFKYIAVVERGKKKAALHYHVITKSIDDNNLVTLPALSACWEGKLRSYDMYEQGDFEQLADYLVKADGKGECEGATYHRSRNLEEPVPEKEVVYFKRFPEEPEVPKGWYVVKESVRRGRNRYTQKPYQRYLLRRCATPGRKEVSDIHVGQKTREKRQEGARRPRGGWLRKGVEFLKSIHRRQT